MLTDQEIESRIREKYRKAKNQDVSAMLKEIAEMKEMRDSAYRAKFNDVNFDKAKTI